MTYKRNPNTIPSPVPTDYDRQADFTSYEANFPNRPIKGTQLDAEFNAIERALDETQDRLALIQRDDGALRNESVHPDALSVEVRTVLATQGARPRGEWLPDTAYEVLDLVEFGNSAYLAVVAHTSGDDFMVDRAAGLWMVMTVTEYQDILDEVNLLTISARNYATAAGVSEDNAAQSAADADADRVAAQAAAAAAAADRAAVETLTPQAAASATAAGVSEDNAAQSAAAALANAQATFGAAVPVGAPMAFASRAHLAAQGNGYRPLDGQLVNKSDLPASFLALLTEGKLPVVTETAWQTNSTIDARASYVDGATTVRFPDLNGKSSGGKNAVTLRGDGRGADAAGRIQGDQVGQHDIDVRTTSYTPGFGPVYLSSKTALAAGFPTSTADSWEGYYDSGAISITARKNRLNSGAETRAVNTAVVWAVRVYGIGQTEPDVQAEQAAEAAAASATLADQYRAAAQLAKTQSETARDAAIAAQLAAEAAAASASATVLRADLADPTKGSSIVGYLPAGAGTVARTAQDKLREYPSRADYGSDAAFNTAKVGKPNIDGDGVFSAPVKPTGASGSLDLSDALLSVAYGPRDVVVYGSATSAKMSRRYATMGGFRFRGQYTKGRAPMFPMSTQVASLSGSGLGAESANTKENWYAAFACANSGGAQAVVRTMPFLRVGSVAGNVVTLNKAGEGVHAVSAQTYSWITTNNLAGVECLVIGENGQWSGRVTTITANTGTTVTLASAGMLAFGDFLLPAPPGFAHYCYLGSFYMDTEEVRNIYDTGHVVKSKGIYILSPNIDGAQTNVNLDVRGYISPLATGVILRTAANLSTTSAGNVAEYFSPDSNGHTVASFYYVKQVTTSVAYEGDNLEIPFLYPQSFYYTNGGSLAASRASGRLHVVGWFEP